MFSSIKDIVEKFIFKQVLNRIGGKVLPALYKKTEGWRTYSLIALWGLLKAAVVFGWLPAEVSAAIGQYLETLLGAAGVTFLSKYNRVNEQFHVEELAAKLRAEANEQMKADGVIK